MSAPAPALLPLWRSANQLRLLTALLLEPERSFTIAELVEATGIPQPSVSREVGNLLRAGVLTRDVEHRRRTVRADTDSPIFPELAGLVLKTAGPKVVLERHLAGLPGVERALIYGSWAKRYSGVAGPPPRDVDVMIFGRPDARAVQHRAEAASRELGRDVNTTVFTPDELSRRRTGFVAAVMSEQFVELDVTPEP